MAGPSITTFIECCKRNILDIVVPDPWGTRCGLSISTGVYFDQRLLAEKHLILGKRN
jgi:hypothetical protein